MATATPTDGAPQGGQRDSLPMLAGAILFLTALAAGAGTMLGGHLSGPASASAADPAAAPASGPETLAAPAAPRHGPGTVLHKVPPVVANLAPPGKAWIRIEASMLYADGAVEDPDLLASEIAQDLLAWLRTVSAAQLQGASGLMHLREDIDDRVAIRSEGRVRELVVETLVVQ